MSAAASERCDPRARQHASLRAERRALAPSRGGWAWAPAQPARRYPPLAAAVYREVTATVAARPLRAAICVVLSVVLLHLVTQCAEILQRLGKTDVGHVLAAPADRPRHERRARAVLQMLPDACHQQLPCLVILTAQFL